MSKKTQLSIEQIKGKYIREEKRKELSKIPRGTNTMDMARKAVHQSLKKVRENLKS